MLNKHNLTIAKLASAEDARYTTSGILVEPKQTIVTDGHLLFAISTMNIPVTDFPLGGRQDALSEDFKPFILPKRTAIEIAGSIKKSSIPALECVAVARSDENGAEIIATDLETEQAFRTRLHHGQYPNWRAVMPKGEAKVEICFGIKILESALATLKALDVHSATFRFYDGDSAIRIDATVKGTKQAVTAVVMPMRGIQAATDWTATVEKPATPPATTDDAVTAPVATEEVPPAEITDPAPITTEDPTTEVPVELPTEETVAA